MPMKPAAKRASYIILSVALAVWAIFFGPLKTVFAERVGLISNAPKSIEVGTANPDANVSSVPQIPLPSATPVNGQARKILVMAWNSQMGLMLANGGPRTTQGSLMQKYGANVLLVRQDNCDKMKEELLAHAQAFHDGNANPTSGTPFFIVMGDGGAQFAAALAPSLEKLGYKPKGIGSTGRSFGEDKIMGPEEWKTNPQSMKGAVIAAYLRDGDWNIGMKYIADNPPLKNNPDETTYDPEAVNWMAANDFLEAVDKVITGVTETRRVVRNGILTNETVTVKAKGCATWTPGDVRLAEKKGGLVTVISTKEYSGQMPSIIFTYDAWAESHRKEIKAMLHAIFDAGDQIKNYPEALSHAARISAQVYGEKDGAYWEKYYRGVTERDRQGLQVELGGSRVHNLADNVELFGPQQAYAATYETFGRVVVEQYPNIVSSYPPASDFVDASFVTELSNENPSAPAAESYTYSPGAAVNTVVGRTPYMIKFETGSSRISGGQESILTKLKNDLTVARSLKVVIHGHTDNTGTPEGNMALSESRAFSVKSYLENTYPSIFPSGRISVIAHGQSDPVESNSTPVGRAANRRVEIVTGTSE